MKLAICEAPFDPLQALARYQQELAEWRGQYGATAIFIGVMRDFNEGDTVHSMTLEHYPGMTERRLQELMQEVRQRWEVLDILLIHRVGQIHPNDPIVLVAIWSAHRAAAFEACRHIVEVLKAQAPFWKQETLADSTHRWVDKNTPG